MKVLLINGSSSVKGCTYTALSQVAKVLEEAGIETEIFQIGGKPVRDCIGCGACRKLDSACVFDDDLVNGLIDKCKTADGFVFGSPVYYSHPSGRLLSVMDRIFYAAGSQFRHKPAFAVVSARRGGTTASLDAILKHFTISQMPVVSSTYWCMVHGTKPEEVRQDLEGLQIMRNAGRNMAWLLRCIEAGKAQGIVAPANEYDNRTNFIR